MIDKTSQVVTKKFGSVSYKIFIKRNKKWIYSKFSNYNPNTFSYNLFFHKLFHFFKFIFIEVKKNCDAKFYYLRDRKKKIHNWVRSYFHKKKKPGR